jgi:ABC-type branched-subunit amino acid transport system ATPase component/ABC-type branched-subunit amino acid transport system permease subunit
VATVVLRKDVLRVRGEVVRRLPAVGSGTIRPATVAAAVVILGLGSWLLTGSALDGLITSLIAGVIGLSVVVSTGYAGQLSLATYAVMGVAALSTAHAAATWHLPFPVSVVVGLATGMATGAVIGLISLRVKGDTVAIVTLGVALALQALVLANPDLTGGINGIAMPSPQLFGINLDALEHPSRFATVCAVVLILAAVVTANVRRGSSGRRLVATRGSERAAQTMGISPKGAKVYAMALAGGLAGLGGGLEAFSQPTVLFSGFTVDASMALLVAVVLGGIGYIAAAPMAGLAVTGGLVYFLLTLTGWQLYLPLALGLLLLINIVLVPDGVVPQNAKMLRALVPHRISSRSADPTAMDLPVTPPVPVEVPGIGLSVDHLTLAFGGIKALDEVSLTVEPGRVEGLIGPNGAGKTSLIDAVTGVTRSYTGTVRFGGQPIDRVTATGRARAGIGRTLQGLELFEDLTVLENLTVGSESRSSLSYLRDLVRPRQVTLSPAALAAIERFSLGAVLHRKPGELPYGQRRLVAIARAVASQPSVLLLDEPAAGLSAKERVELAELIRELAETWKMGILLIEHDVDLVMKVSDHLTVLESGRVIAQGTAAETRLDPNVRRAFLGEEVSV